MTLDKLSILYVGSLDVKLNSYKRFAALSTISSNISAIDTDPYIEAKYIAGFQHHLNIGPGIYLLNWKVKRSIKVKNYDVVLVDNKSYLTVKTLRYIKRNQPSAKIVNLLTDDPFGKFTKSWKLIKRTAFLYDIFFVQREVNIEELKNRGAKRVELCYRSFDPKYNRPILLKGDDYTKYHTSVGFIGTHEDERASYIAFLIQNNIPVNVTGAGWPNNKYWDIIKPYYKAPFIYGDDYIKALCGMDIALHFLRHANRDEQDSRTFEIPSCKVFMLAEHSSVHLQLFKENEEAVFFSSKEEMLEKVRFYQSAKQERERIALNGYKRCYSSGYDHKSRMKAVLESITNSL